MDKDKILEQYKSGFSSSPIEVSDEEIELLIKNNCACEYCGTSIFELYDFPNFTDSFIDISETNEVICEECFEDNYKETCLICEEWFISPQNPKEHHFVICEKTEKEEGIKAGIYQVLDYPFFVGATGFGFQYLFDNSVKLVKPFSY